MRPYGHGLWIEQKRKMPTSEPSLTISGQGAPRLHRRFHCIRDRGRPSGMQRRLVKNRNFRRLTMESGKLSLRLPTERQGSSGVEQRTHKPLVAGSIPAPATSAAAGATIRMDALISPAIAGGGVHYRAPDAVEARLLSLTNASSSEMAWAGPSSRFNWVASASARRAREGSARSLSMAE